MHRGRITAGLLALATCFAFAAVTNSAAFAGPQDAPAAGAARIAAAPVTSSDTADGRTLSADNAIALTESGATVAVVGAGFDPEVDVFVAICNVAATAQTPLTDCLGGAVPAANPTKAWSWVSKDANRPNGVSWSDNGFTASLVISSPDGIGPVCGENQCVIIARTDGEASTRAADITIPVTFTGDDPTPSSEPETTSTTTTTTTSTSEQPTAPLTVSPQSVVSPEIAVGGVQTIVFAQFQAGEQVTVGLFPGPIELPAVLASDVGVVTISFTITSEMSSGLHTVQAVGVQSGTVGIAEFNISAPPPVTSTPVTTSSSVASSTETTTSASVTSESTTSEEATTSTTTTDAAPIATDGESSSLWWLWVTIVLVVLVGGVTGAVALSRRRAALLAEEEEAKEEELAEAAERAAQDRTAGQQPYQPEQAPPSPYDYSDDHGLLSGREHPDGPALYSGQGGYTPEAPTQRIETPEQRGLGKPRMEPPTTRMEPPTTRIPAPGSQAGGFVPPPAGAVPQAPGADASAVVPDGGPSTSQWRPDFADAPADPGPSTSQWSPDFGDAPADAQSDPVTDGGPATQAWQPPPVDPDDDPPTDRQS